MANYKLTYGDRWSYSEGTLANIWKEDKARGAHSTRRLYVVLFENTSVRGFIEVANGYFGVYFLDELNREYLGYQFTEQTPGRIFLTLITRREFGSSGNQADRVIRTKFLPDGKMFIGTYHNNGGEDTEVESSADVSGNWETYPEFGQYEEILRKDR